MIKMVGPSTGTKFYHPKAVPSTRCCEPLTHVCHAQHCISMYHNSYEPPEWTTLHHHPAATNVSPKAKQLIGTGTEIMEQRGKLQRGSRRATTKACSTDIESESLEWAWDTTTCDQPRKTSYRCRWHESKTSLNGATTCRSQSMTCTKNGEIWQWVWPPCSNIHR